MGPIDALYNSHVFARLLLSISICFVSVWNQSIEERISQVFEKFNFFKESGLLQFWKCIESHDSEDNGWHVVLSDQSLRFTDPNHEGLKNYWRKSHDNVIRFVGAQKKVTGNWLAGRAAQTQIADQRTKDFVDNHHYQQDAEAAGMGQCVLPVFDDVGDRKLVGIIELVTIVPKDSYVEDFNQLVQLLQARSLKSSYMGKTIKVQYDHHLIKFGLPISAKFTELLKKVTKRFPGNKYICIKYKDNHRISDDEDLQKCMKESSSKGEAFIKMFVEHADGACDCTSEEIL